MQGIISGCKACFPAMLFFFFFIGTLSYLIWLAKKKPLTFRCVIITSLIVISGTLLFEHLFFPRFKRIISRRKTVEQDEWRIYDTDPRNDEFIKGRLGLRELRQLDVVLQKEKENEGMPFDSATLQEITRYDPKIIEAYWRWRKCKDMRRSYHKTIYPDERQLYHYLR